MERTAKEQLTENNEMTATQQKPENMLRFLYNRINTNIQTDALVQTM